MEPWIIKDAGSMDIDHIPTRAQEIDQCLAEIRVLLDRIERLRAHIREAERYAQKAK